MQISSEELILYDGANGASTRESVETLPLGNFLSRSFKDFDSQKY